MPWNWDCQTVKACSFTDDRCQACPQLAYGKNNWCAYHLRLKLGLISKVDKVLTPVELDTLFGGRRRDDGRRLDHYTPAS